MSDRKYVEKRRYLRFDFKTKIYIAVVESITGYKSTGKLSAVSKNMSVEGICFFSSKELTRGTIVEVDILFPFEINPIHVKGEVKWCKALVKNDEGELRYEVGVNLVDIGDRDEAKFLKYNCDKMMEYINKPKDKERR